MKRNLTPSILLALGMTSIAFKAQAQFIIELQKDDFQPFIQEVSPMTCLEELVFTRD